MSQKGSYALITIETESPVEYLGRPEVEQLKRAYLLRGVAEASLKTLQNTSKLYRYSRKAMIFFQQGDAQHQSNHSVYVTVAGKVRIAGLENNYPVHHRYAHPADPSDTFGEVEALATGPFGKSLNLASAQAYPEATVIELDTQSLKECVASDPVLRDNLLALLAMRVAEAVLDKSDLAKDASRKAGMRQYLIDLAQLHGVDPATGYILADVSTTDMEDALGITRQYVSKLGEEMEMNGEFRIDVKSKKVQVLNQILLSRTARVQADEATEQK